MKTVSKIACCALFLLSSGDLLFADFQDDFEDGVIDSNLWVVGGSRGGVGGPGSGSGQWYNVEENGYVEAGVTTPMSGNTYGATAWTRTVYNFNDGRDWVINFRWETVNAGAHPWHADYHLIEITDGNTAWHNGYYTHPEGKILRGTEWLWFSNGIVVGPHPEYGIPDGRKVRPYTMVIDHCHSKARFGYGSPDGGWYW